MTSRPQRTPIPTKTVRTIKSYPADPPGTPPITREWDERSKTSNGVERPSTSANKTPKKIPPTFNRTSPSPVSPRVLFPPPKNDGSHLERKHISPPSVRRRGQENGVCLWELEDEDDIPALSDSSGESSLKEASSPEQIKRTSASDVNSDPGIRYSRAKKTASKPTTSSSFNGGRIVSPPKRRNKSMIEPNTHSGNLPTSPDEHAARLNDIMSKRKKKKKRKKIRKRSNTDGSDVNGVSSNTKSTSSFSNYADDPVNYLNDKLQNSIKSEDEVSDTGSSRSSISSLGSRGSMSSSKASANKKWKHAKIEKEYPKLIDPDKQSDVSSDISGASNTSSSIFAATRAKLKGYLTTYKKAEKKKVHRKYSNKSTTTTTSLQSPARASSSCTERVQGTPDTLFSIDESDLDSPPRKKPSESPPTTSGTSRHQKSFEEKVSHLSTSPPSSSVTDKDNAATQVIDLPWCYNNKGTVSDDNFVTDLNKGGLYSGPVNELLKPHGNGNLVVKAMNDSFVTLYGTWDDGRLVSPLVDEKEPATDDENDVDDKPEPCSPRGRLKVKNDIIIPNNIKQPTKSIKYTVNSHYKHNRISRAVIQKERKAINKMRERTNKNRRKPKQPPIAKYNIGDACRTPQDMIICCSKEESIDSAGHMKKWDGAFIKRTSGVWTYAILIERSMQPIDVTKKRLEYMYWASVWEVDPRCEMEDSMLFAIDDDGGTKIIPKRCWAKYVRRVRHNPKPDLSRGTITNPLPTEVTVEQPSTENDDDATQNSESSEYFKIITQHNDSSAKVNNLMSESLYSSGFDDSEKEANASTVYPC